MGFASFREDIVSRFNNKSQAPASKVAAQSPVAKQGPPGGHPPTAAPNVGRMKEFTVATARPLPVILMADVSGSMAADGKIDALNSAVAEMLAAFSQQEEGRAEIHVAVVTFGGREATLHVPLTPAKELTWKKMTASGQTPLGSALDLVSDLLEDRTRIPGRAYRPTIILVSDGRPEGEAPGKWEASLARLLNSERAKKAQRFAMAIGADALKSVLGQFLNEPEVRIFEAHEVREIRRFFKWVTMSVTSRTRSAQPNEVVDIKPLDVNDYGGF